MSCLENEKENTIMVSEKDMENAIANNPKRYLGENGLLVIDRQHRIGDYIFDLLFQDRHGAKLIVEMQKGTLDRSHTYKILDYYDAYREKNLQEFIDLMVIANIIPEERKKRLRAWGVEFREIPEAEFISSSFTSEIVLPDTTTNIAAKSMVGKSNVPNDSDAMKSYLLFKEQKNRFVMELQKIEKVSLKFTFNDLNAHNISSRSNWVVCWIPHKWGVFKQTSAGVHFAFLYYRDRKCGIEYIRFPVGVEKPLKTEFHEIFKTEVVENLKQRNVSLTDCRLWPDPGFRRAKLLEPKHIILDHNT